MIRVVLCENAPHDYGWRFPPDSAIGPQFTITLRLDQRRVIALRKDSGDWEGVKDIAGDPLAHLSALEFIAEHLFRSVGPDANDTEE